MLALGTILFSQTTLIVNIMGSEFLAGNREDAMLDALESISRVLGKQAEYHEFVEYVNWAGKDDMPSPTNIASHTPTWVQLLMPLLGKLYDTGYNKGRLDAGFGFDFKEARQESRAQVRQKENITLRGRFNRYFDVIVLAVTCKFKVVLQIRHIIEPPATVFTAIHHSCKLARGI